VLSKALGTAHGNLPFQKVDGLVAHHLLVTHSACINARTHDAPANHLAVLVVHGNGPAHDVKAAEKLLLGTVFGGVGMQAQIGQDLVLNTDKQIVLAGTTRTRAGQAAAIMYRDELHVGRHFHGGRAYFVKGGALVVAAYYVLGSVQGSGVEVVSSIVLHLQPVAVLEVAESHQFIAGHDGEVFLPFGERRFGIGRAHIGKNQAMALEGLVSSLTDGAGVFFALGL